MSWFVLLFDIPAETDKLIKESLLSTKIKRIANSVSYT